MLLVAHLKLLNLLDNSIFEMFLVLFVLRAHMSRLEDRVVKNVRTFQVDLKPPLSLDLAEGPQLAVVLANETGDILG